MYEVRIIAKPLILHIALWAFRIPCGGAIQVTNPNPHIRLIQRVSPTFHDLANHFAGHLLDTISANGLTKLGQKMRLKAFQCRVF